MDRLDKIVARNQRPPWYRNKPLLFACAVALAIAMVALAMMTRLGQPRTPDAPAPSASPPNKTHVQLRAR